MPDEAPPLNRGMVTAFAIPATLLQVLDTMIANVALPYMQGSVSASQHQIAWVLTSSVAAAAIMMPPTGYLANRFGVRRLFLVSVAGLTAMSVRVSGARACASVRAGSIRRSSSTRVRRAEKLSASQSGLHPDTFLLLPNDNVLRLGPDLDLSGGTRRHIEQERALAAVQQGQLASAYMTLTSDAVTDTIALARASELAASLAQPVFDGGTRRARRQAAIAAFHASADTYRQTVLDALREAARDERRSLAIASEAVGLQQINYAAGGTGLLNLLDAQPNYQQAELGFVRAEGRRFTDTALLLAAMGGGWWNALALASAGR